MSGTEWTAERVLAELTPGMRMRILFDTAKAATWIAPEELETLFAEPSYEARMAAFCILGVVLAEPLLARLRGARWGGWRAAGGLLAWALVGILMDWVLKATLAPMWGRVLRGAMP